MKAAYFQQTGPAKRVLVVGDLPDPQPAAAEVRVRLELCGVNASDVKARSGARGPTMPFPRVIPYSDGMGGIDAVGAKGDPARIGQWAWVWNVAWLDPMGQQRASSSATTTSRGLA